MFNTGAVYNSTERTRDCCTFKLIAEKLLKQAGKQADRLKETETDIEKETQGDARCIETK